MPSLLNYPTGTLRVSIESFKVQRGVRQGSKKAFFYVTFQLALKIYSLLKVCPVHTTKKAGEKWKPNHIECADDLCLIAPTTAVKIIERLAEVNISCEYNIQIGEDETVWLSVRIEDCL